MQSEEFDDLIGLFIAETQEFLQSLETNLLILENNQTVEERLQAVKTLFRVAHSIKGSASMFGLDSLSKAAHSLEDCFAILRDCVELSQLEPKTITGLLKGVDSLKKIADRVCFQKNNAISIAAGITCPSENSHDLESLINFEMQTIAQTKNELENQYGKPEEKTISSINASVNITVIKAIFENELGAIFSQLETEIYQCNPEILSQTIAIINDIYYQISGVAGMLQLSFLTEISEQLKALIDTPDLTVEQLQSSGWIITQNLQTIRTQIIQGEEVKLAPSVEEEIETGEEQNSESIVDIFDEVFPDSPSTSVVSSSSYPLTPSSSTWQRPTIRVDVERLTELINLVGELVINRTNFEVQETQLRSETKRIRKSILTLRQFGSQLREEYDSLAGETQRVGNWKKGKNLPHKAIFDALELDQYTEFHTTATEVIEVTQAIAQSASAIDELAIKFERNTEQLRRITERLRSRVMQLRVVPFSRAVDHLPRALRELSHAYNKDINLLLLGRDTKIDEGLLDALREPLVHLLRNAFDHGIEPPQVRLAAGKPATGQIEIEARHQGGQTIITVTDDGRGIDPEQIRSKLIKMELLPAEQASNLQINDLYEFLFWPGFSTASEITNLSGRGVGLDVVRNNLRQVRGNVKIDSRPGKGTSFILKLPLMLSITDALMVRVDRNTIAVPLDAVEEIVHIQGNEIHMAGNHSMLRWQGEFIRLVRLQELLKYSLPHPDGPSPDPLNQDYIPVMILAGSEGVLAVAIERIIGQQEIVVKPLPSPLSKPRGIVGCTILGDGEVVTILDVDDLIEQFYNHGSSTISISSKSPNWTNTEILPPASVSQPQILVVDDSYTIRQLLSVTLTRARYRVIQAKDGQDALFKLEQGMDCHLVIADIEMPRMDGFELLRNIKSNPKLTSIPVAMLTSRSGARHRQMAIELGAIEYFTKPYNEIQLLDVIAKLIKNCDQNSN